MSQKQRWSVLQSEQIILLFGWMYQCTCKCAAICWPNLFPAYGQTVYSETHSVIAPSNTSINCISWFHDKVTWYFSQTDCQSMYWSDSHTALTQSIETHKARWAQGLNIFTVRMAGDILLLLHCFQGILDESRSMELSTSGGFHESRFVFSPVSSSCILYSPLPSSRKLSNASNQ